HQIEPRFLPELHEPVPGEEPVMALSDRVREHELFGFLIVGPEVLAPPDGGRPADELLWHTDTPTYDDLPRWIRGQVNELAQSRRLADVGIDAALVARLSADVPLHTMGLARLTAEGEVR